MPTFLHPLARNFAQDLRFALRQLRRSPGFLATAVLTLALGIGATTAVFSVVYQVLLRSLPVSQPEQLYKVGQQIDCCVSTGLEDDWSTFSFDLYRYLRDHTPDTAGIAAVQAGSTAVTGRRAGDATAAAQPLGLRFVSGNYFSVVGVQPFAGRLLTPEDDRPEAPPVAVISHILWQTKFAADPTLVGSTLLLTGHPVTVIGITAQNFLGERNSGDPAGLWVPLTHEPLFDLDRPLLHFPGTHWLDLLARIPNPSQVSAVQLALQGELHQWLNANRQLIVEPASAQDFARQTTELAPASSGINDLRDEYEQSLRLLLLVTGFVLLIACANLASLMLVRGMARGQELAIRSSLGAPRRRLVTQMLVEAVVLSLLGGTISLPVAYAGTRAVLASVMRGVSVSPLTAYPSFPILAFAFALSLLTGILFGTAPAWITSRANPADSLRQASRTLRDTTALPQKLLVILQAALSLALLSTAGLLLTSLHRLRTQDFRFSPDHRLILSTDLSAAGYTFSELPALYQRLNAAFAHMPGLDGFAYATYGPMVGWNWNDSVYLPGASPGTDNIASYSVVSPQYFQTIGTRLLLGRSFSVHDTSTSAPVAIVNRAFVQEILHGKQPLGERFGATQTTPSTYEIIGVVDDTKYRHLDRPTAPMFFTPANQVIPYTDPQQIAKEHAKQFAGNLIFHYRGDDTSIATTIRQTLRGIDPNIPINKLQTYTDQVAGNFTQQDLVVRLTSLFGIVALCLAALGLYGVTAYTVARRTGEIGIRMALGATRGSVLGMILRAALSQAVLGLALGLPLAFIAGRLLQHSLYQTSTIQPLVLFAVSGLLVVSTLGAALLPARRAASIDPNTALRAE